MNIHNSKLKLYHIKDIRDGPQFKIIFLIIYSFLFAFKPVIAKKFKVHFLSWNILNFYFNSMQNAIEC